MNYRVCLALHLPLLLASPCLGQATLFEENFDAGIPASWSHIKLGWSSDVWGPGFGQVDGSPDLYHEWFCDNGFSWRDNTLVSPAIDLRGYLSVDFVCDQYQPDPLAMDYNAIEVSIDGGVSFTPVLDLAGTPTGISTLTASLDAFIGLEDVRVALHYQGYVANGWSVDNVRVTTPKLPLEATPPSISLSAGGVQSFALDAGPQYGSELYLVFASSSGTSPGLLFDGVPIPINYDALTQLSLNGAGLHPWLGTFGLLAADGTAAAQFSLTPGLSPSLAGVVIQHVFGVFDLSQFGTLVFASNPQSVELTP